MDFSALKVRFFALAAIVVLITGFSKFAAAESHIDELPSRKHATDRKEQDNKFPPDSAYEIVFIDERWPDRPFTIKIPSENRNGVRSLEYYLGKGLKKENGELNIGTLDGQLRKTVKTEGHGWSFEFDPNTVSFSAGAVEECDATLMYIEENLDKWLSRTHADWCPWNTGRNIRSIKRTKPRPPLQIWPPAESLE
jgi:hypothetical protein